MSLRPELPGWLTGIDALEARLATEGYIADRALATVLYLSLTMGRPLFLEGEAGVGKTEVARITARMLGRPLIRLQCYEGLDVHSAVYEWNYPRQLLYVRLMEQGSVPQEAEKELFSSRFLVARPLLQAIDPPDGRPVVLLIDELDRADDEFEAFLLEVLSDFQVTIPELGTIRARTVPAVIITSNRTREIHDALKRRCLYHWIDYPSFDREYRILRTRVPGVEQRLARQVSAFVQRLRGLDLYKLPGVAETIDWATALQALGQRELNEAAVTATLGCLLKYQDDLAHVREAGPGRLLAEALASAGKGAPDEQVVTATGESRDVTVGG